MRKEGCSSGLIIALAAVLCISFVGGSVPQRAEAAERVTVKAENENSDSQVEQTESDTPGGIVGEPGDAGSDIQSDVVGEPDDAGSGTQSDVVEKPDGTESESQENKDSTETKGDGQTGTESSGQTGSTGQTKKSSSGSAKKTKKAKKVFSKGPKLTVKMKSYRAVLSWKKLKGAKSYVVQRAAKKNGKFKVVASTKKRRWKDKTVKTGHTYYYRVYAVGKNNLGKKEKSPCSSKKRITVPMKPPASLKGKNVTSSTCELSWKKVKRATRYVIYRASKAGGAYKRIKTTKKTVYTDRNLESQRKYYYKVAAVGKSNLGFKFSTALGKQIAVTTKKKVRKVAYVGDSVMAGIGEYKVVQDTDTRRVIYKIGVSPYVFYNGPLMDELLDYNPDLMFIMLGMNSLDGNPSDRQMEASIRYYKEILEECLAENPDMQIVVLSVSPTRPQATAKNSSVNRFNAKLEEMVKTMKKVRYYNFTAPFKERDGTLLGAYSEGDGIHWKIAGYRKLKEVLDAYEKTL